MITVTLVFADGREQITEVDPGMDPYPLTIKSLRIPDMVAWLTHSERLWQREHQHALDMADAEAFLQRISRMTAEEIAAEDHERWQTFELVDPQALRYRERV